MEEDEQDEADDDDEPRHAAASAPSASARAARSASTRSSRSRTGIALRGCERLPDDVGDREERTAGRRGRRRRRPRSRRCRRTGALPPFSPASRASASIGNVSVSGAENSSVSDGEVERRDRRRRALGVRERVRDRHAHVRVAEMRERGAVAEADERVDDRRRLDRDLDPVVRNAEEKVRLDQLEPLVRERRGVHRDLRAHAPGRMCERLLGRDVLELGARAAAERAARAGEDERVDLLRLASLEALEERRVLAVDGQDPPAAPLCARERELAGGDEALLVREREVDAALERPERRVDAGEADDGVEDDVGLGAVEELGQIAADLLERRVDVVERRRAGGGGAELELGMRLDDLDRLAADRAGCAEQRDALHRISVGSRVSGMVQHGTSITVALKFEGRASDRVRTCVGSRRTTTMKYAAGAAKRSASIRSSTPPWPPSRRPVSFTSRSRLSADSNRSPSDRGRHDDDAEHDRLPDAEVVVARVVERDERDEDAGDRAADEALPRLLRREARRELVTADERPTKYASVSAANTVSTTVNAIRRPSVCISRSRRSEAEPEPDPRRRRARSSRRAAVVGARVLGQRVEDEGEHERREEAAEQPGDPSHLGPEQREEHADVDRRRERPQRPRGRHELVDARRTPPRRRARTATSRRARACRARAAGRPRDDAAKLRATAEVVRSRCRRIYGAGSRTPRSRPAARPARSRARACR